MKDQTVRLTPLWSFNTTNISLSLVPEHEHSSEEQHGWNNVGKDVDNQRIDLPNGVIPDGVNHSERNSC